MFSESNQILGQLSAERATVRSLGVEVESLRSSCACDCDSAPSWYRYAHSTEYIHSCHFPFGILQSAYVVIRESMPQPHMLRIFHGRKNGTITPRKTGHSASGIPSRQTRDSLRGLTPILRRSSRLQFHLQRLKQLRQVLSRR
jgi:hypothetical protein